MQRSHSFELVSYNPKIEKTLCVITVAQKRETQVMAK